MKGYGVRRLVVINSGSYRFADVALDGPIHLVAPNNRGKSTLVNALQFLYVDEFRSMRFPKSPEETREHYFGNAVSYLVFECTTATGPQSLLVVGRGRVNSSAFLRFVFSGGYQAEDFQDAEGRVVSFEVLRARLADRSLIEVRPAELWEVLGNPTRRARPEHNGHQVAHLGLLPIKAKEDYRSFRETYVRLLSLSDADAAELRRLLISCHAAQVGEIRLDVAADYRDEFERAERADIRLAFLRAVASMVDDGERLRTEIESNADVLRMTAPQCLAEASRCRSAIATSAVEFGRLETEVQEAQTAIAERRSQAERRLGGTEHARDQLAQELAGVDGLHARWSICSPEMLQTMRDNADALQDQIAVLREYLRQAGTFKLGVMQRSVDSLRSDVAVQERSLSNWEHRVSAWLLAHGLKPQELADVFRVLNPALLHLLVGEDVSVSDPPAVLRRLRALSGRIGDDAYSDEVMRLRLSSIGGPPAEDLRDPEAARQKLSLIRGRLEEELRRLGVAQDIDRAKAELNGLEAERASARARLDEHDRYLVRWQERPGLQARLDSLNASLSDAERTITVLEAEGRELADKGRSLADDKAATTELLNHLSTAQRNCLTETDNAQVVLSDAATTPHELAPPPAISVKELRSITEGCRKSLNALATRAGAIRSTRQQLKSLESQITRISQEHPGQLVYFSDEEAEWVELIDGRRAMAELEQTAAQSWETLFTTITAKLNALVLGARAISNAAVRVNAAMRRHRVSNLREVQLDVVRQHEACDLLESLTRPDGLFTDRDALGRAKDQLRRWIKDGKVIQLDDLFAVRIRVQGMDGQWNEARSLDDIGSTGTRMTAKAMIFIQLVRAVVDDERYRLHFYLDETGQLDDDNLQAITQMASERGIVPITAEPRVRVEPLAHPTVTVYALGQSAEGKFDIDAKRTIRAARHYRQTEPAEHVPEPA